MLGEIKQRTHFVRRLVAVVGLCAASLFALVMMLVDAGLFAWAVSPPNVLPYQGRILNANGVPVADATANMQFRLYDSLAAGTCLWSNDSSSCATDDDQVVTLTDGLFSENLGDTAVGYAAILDSVFADDASVFLEVEIEGEVLTPRKPLGATAYAFNADTLDGLDSASFTIDSEACLLAGGADCEMEPAGVTFPGVGASITTGTARFGDGVLYPALMIDGSASPNTAIGFGIDDYISFHGTQAEFVEQGGSFPPAIRFYYDATAEPQIISVHRVGTGEMMWSLYGGASTDYSVMYGPTDGSDDTGALYFEATGASNVGTAHIGSYQLRNGASTTPIACFSDDLGQSGAAPNRKACMMANTTFVLGQDVGSTDIVMAQAGFSKDSASTETITFTNPGAGVLDVTVDGGLTVDTTTLFVDDTTNEIGVGTITPDAFLDIESAEDTEHIRLSDSTNVDSAGIYVGDGTAGLDGTLSAQAGSLFLDEDGKLWVNVNGATDWQDLTVAGGFDSTTIDNTTWSDGANASNTWTFDVSGTDHTMVFGSGLVTFGDSVTVTDALTATGSLVSNGTTTIGDAVTDNLTVAAAIQGANALIFDGATDNTNETTFVITDPSADNTITFQNGSGTVAFLTDITGSFATTALDNLASVAINTSLISDTNDTDDLGSDAIRWRDLYLGGETIHLGTSVTDEATFGYNTTTNILGIGTDSTTNGDIAFFTDDLYLDKSAGSVGIGDTTPDALLDVAGTFQTDGNVTFGDAAGDFVTSTAANWVFSSDTSIVLSGGGNGINFDSNTLSIDATSNFVAIGTASPEAFLDVEAPEDTEHIRLTDSTNGLDSAGLYVGDGTAGLDGALSAQAGSLFLDTDGKLWVNVDGTTDWQDLTVAGGFDSTTIDNTTWSDGANASNTWTFDVSGTDHTMVFGSGLVTFGDSVTVTDALTATGSLVSNGTTTIGDAVTDNLTVAAAIQGANALIFDGATDNTNETTFVITDPSADNTITFQNGSGTVAFLTDISGSFANTTLSNLGATAINADLIPDSNDDTNLGSDALRWADLFLGPGTLNIGTSDADDYELSYDTTNNDLVLNEDSDNVDVRIEGNGNANLFFVDAANDRIGIGTAAPATTLEIETGGSETNAQVQNTTTTGVGRFIVRDDGGSLNINMRMNGSATAGTFLGYTETSAAYLEASPASSTAFHIRNASTSPTVMSVNGVEELTITTTEVVVNQAASASVDLRVEGATSPSAFFVDASTDDVIVNDTQVSSTDFIARGDTNANLLFVDASADFVGIGTATPATTLEIETGAATTVAQVQNTTTTGVGRFIVRDDGGSLNVGLKMNGSAVAGTFLGYTEASASYLETSPASGTAFHIRNASTSPTVMSVNGLEALTITSTEVVINESSNIAMDFRAETDLNANGIFLDASAETIDLVGGSASTGCSISSAGALACSGAITSNGVGFWTLDGTAQTVTADKAITLSGGVNGLSFDGTTFSIDAQNDSIGIGTAAPGAKLQLDVAQPASVGTGTGTAATDALYVFGGTGGDTTIATTGTGGIGSDISVTAGNGGIAGSATTQSTGGDGGTQQLSGGDGGNADVTGGIKRGGDGGFLLIDSGEGGSTSGTGTSNTGGEGGFLMLLTANGGDATGATSNTGGAGGELFIISGDGGTGSTAGGVGGDISITAGGGGTNANGGSIFIEPGSGNGTGIAGVFDVRGSTIFNEAGANFDFRIEGDTNANLIFVDASADSVGIGTGTPGATLDVDAADVTGGGSTESILFRAAAQTIALADGTTRTNQRQNQFIAPTINGVAAGGTETVTNAATLYVDAAPSGSNITITNPYALWVDAGTARLDGTINAPSLTASRALFTDSSSNLSASGTSAMLEAALSDETGSGSVMMAIAPFISTSLQAASSSFDLLDATATTINFGGATTTLNLAGGSGSGGCTINSSGDLTCSGAVTGSGGAGANTALSNLASVAINTSLISDTTNTDDLGSTGIRWKDLWLAGTATVADVVASGDVAVNGADITTSSTGTVTLFNTNATAAGILGAATGAIDIAGGSGSTGVTITGNTGAMAITGNFTTADDVAVNGGDITTTAATGSLFHTGATSGLMFTAATGSVDIAGGSGSTGLTVTGNTGALAISGTLTAGGGGDFTGSLSTDGNTTIGDEGGDSVVSNAADWTFANDTDVILSGGVNGFSLDGTTFSIDATNNRVGIGTAAPAILFEVAGNGAVTGNLAVAGGTTAAEELDVTGQIQFDLDGTTDTTVGVCKDNADAAGVETNVEFRDCSSTPGDIAEWYETTGAERAGDLVMIGDAVLEYDEELYDPFTGLPTGTAETYQAAIMERADTSRPVFGIVSTSPLQTMGEAVKEVSSHPQPIAISGRVPARVNDEGGAIAAGDPITSSSVAGVGMKATEAGMIVGYALEPYSGSGEGVIMVFVSPGYHGGGSDPNVGTSNQASGLAGDLSALNMSGNIYMAGNQIIDVEKISGLGGTWSVDSTGKFTTAGSYDVVIESYQGEKVETHAVLNRTHQVTLNGFGTIQNGMATVTFEQIDPNFNDIISTGAPITVLITPRGPAYLYVTEQGNNGFTVQQLNGSDSDIRFDWMVSAYRKDYEPAEESEELPAEEPPAEEPPAEEPAPAEEPPAEEPVAEEPVVEEPPAETPAVEEPPAEDPPAEPVVEEAPPAEPPAEEPAPPAEPPT